jgi:hypothetical protein
MSTAEEATINPDGSTTFESDSTMPPVADETAGADGAGPDFEDGGDETMGDAVKTAVKGGLLNDPAIFLLIVVVLLGLGYFLYRRKVAADEDDEFFNNLDGEKVRVGHPSMNE